MPPPLHDSQAEQARPLVRKAAIPTHPSRLTLSPSRLVKHFRTRLLRPITRRVATCTESESFLLMHPTIKQTVGRSSSAALIVGEICCAVPRGIDTSKTFGTILLDILSTAYNPHSQGSLSTRIRHGRTYRIHEGGLCCFLPSKRG